jgi:hypothetical protein
VSQFATVGPVNFLKAAFASSASLICGTGYWGRDTGASSAHQCIGRNVSVAVPQERQSERTLGFMIRHPVPQVDYDTTVVPKRLFEVVDAVSFV